MSPLSFENSLNKTEDQTKTSPSFKIAFIRKRFNPYGGAECYLARVMDRLVQLGHEVHIFAEAWKKPSAGETFFFHKVSTLPGPAFVKILSFAFSADISLKRLKMDVVHSFERTLRQDIYRAGDGLHAEWISRRLQGKHWYEKFLFFANPFHLAMLFLEQKVICASNTGYIICNSKRGAREIAQRYKYPDDRIRVVYNGVDLEFFDVRNKKKARNTIRKKHGCSDADLILLFVGSGYRRKGVETLLRSLPLVQEKLGKRNLRCFIVGKEARLSWYQDLAIRLGVDDVVFFEGPLADVRDYYLASDIFILPAIYEPFSNACLEAFACGLPVVTTEANGFSEIIQDKQNGWVLKGKNDIVELSEAILHFSGDAFRGEAGKSARAASENYTIVRSVDEMIEVYREVFAKRPH